MQNKTKTYILLVLVLGVWGIIGFRITSTLNPETPETNHQKDIAAFKPKTETAMDTFSIQTVERDPFLGTLSVKKKPQIKKQFTKQKKVYAWPTISYHGSVTQKNSKNRVFVVSIEQQQYLMKRGQQIKGITLVRGNNDAITVNHKGIRKTIAKL